MFVSPGKVTHVHDTNVIQTFSALPRLQKSATKSFRTATDEAVQLADHEDGIVVWCVIPLDEILEDEWSDTSEDDDAA